MPSAKNKETKAMKPFLRPLLLLVVIFLLIVGWQIYDQYQSNNYKSAYYTSKTFSFSIDFPGTPKYTNTSQTIGTFYLKSAAFNSTVDGSKQQYMLYSYIWPSQINFNLLTAAKMKISLTQALNTLVVNALKGKVVNTSQFLYQGRAVDQAQFSITNPNSQDGFVRVFFVKNLEYCIFSLGSSKTNFNNFADSFKYI
jgi:hypothetical protein